MKLSVRGISRFRLAFLVFIFGGLFTGYLHPEENLMQSLSTASEENQAEILILISTKLQKSNPDEALHYALSAIAVSTRLNQVEHIAMASKLAGNHHYVKKDYNQALEYYQSGLESAMQTNNQKLIADLTNNIGQSYTHKNEPMLALKYLKQALAIRTQFPSRDDEIASLNNIGQVYWNIQDYSECAKYYLAAAKLLDDSKNEKVAAFTYNNLGNAYSKMGDSVKALEAYVRSLRLKETHGNPIDLANANVNIGNLYYHVKDYPNALKYYEAAKSLYFEQGDSIKEAQIALNMGVVYNKLKQYDHALSLYQAALQVFRKAKLSSEIAKTLNNMGNTYKDQERFDEAISFYEESARIKASTADTEGLAISHFNLGEAKLKQKDFGSALNHTLISLKAAEKLNTTAILISIYRQLATIYASLHDYQKAYEALDKYVTLDKELFSNDSRDALAEQLVRFNSEEKSKELNQLQTEHQIQAKKLAEQIRDKFRLIVVLSAIVIITLIMGGLYHQKQVEIKKRYAVQVELEKLNSELEDRISNAMDSYKLQQQIIIQKSKLEALGKLSAGIAHEINQPLSALSMSMDNIEMTALSGKLQTEYLHGKIASMQDDIQRIRQIIDHVRQFSRNQKEDCLEQIDIHKTINSAVSLLQRGLMNQEITIERVFSNDSLFTLGNHFKLEQVFVNLISNSIDAIQTKFGIEGWQNEDKRIILRTKALQDNVVIEVEDNGCGIPDDEIQNVFEPFFTSKMPEQGTGLGLSISYGIINDMQGSISIYSEAIKFSKVTILLPLLRSNNESIYSIGT